MQINDIKTIKPKKDLVIVDIEKVNKKDELYLGDSKGGEYKKVEMYFGEVKSKGPEVTEPLNCPGLEVGDKVAFSQFAGSHIITKEIAMTKVIRGYDIMAILDDLDNISEDTITPTSDRLLVALIDEDNTPDDELYLSSSNKSDPRVSELVYAKVLRVGKSCKDTKIGDLIAFSPYAGETIRYQLSAEKPELKSIREDDTIFSI